MYNIDSYESNFLEIFSGFAKDHNWRRLNNWSGIKFAFNYVMGI